MNATLTTRLLLLVLFLLLLLLLIYTIAAKKKERRHSLPSSLLGVSGSVGFRQKLTNIPEDTSAAASFLPGASLGTSIAKPIGQHTHKSGVDQPSATQPSAMSQPAMTSVPTSLTCFLVQFTSGRTDTYYIQASDAHHLKVNVGDYVVVEADRGEDLGRVIMDNINVPMPRRNSVLISLDSPHSDTHNM